MGLLQVPEIHAIKLVAAQDQNLASAILLNVANVLANGIGGALIPVGGFVGLLGRQDLHETSVEIVKLIGVGDVPVQADAQKLREHVDAVEAAVEAVADGDVDETVLAGHGHGRLAAQHRQREQSSSPPTAQNQAENFFHE